MASRRGFRRAGARPSTLCAQRCKGNKTYQEAIDKYFGQGAGVKLWWFTVLSVGGAELCTVSLDPREMLKELSAPARAALGVKRCQLLTSTGVVLPLSDTVAASGLIDGDVVTAVASGGKGSYRARAWYDTDSSSESDSDSASSASSSSRPSSASVGSGAATFPSGASAAVAASAASGAAASASPASGAASGVAASASVTVRARGDSDSDQGSEGDEAARENKILRWVIKPGPDPHLRRHLRH